MSVFLTLKKHKNIKFIQKLKKSLANEEDNDEFTSFSHLKKEILSFEQSIKNTDSASKEAKKYFHSISSSKDFLDFSNKYLAEVKAKIEARMKKNIASIKEKISDCSSSIPHASIQSLKQKIPKLQDDILKSKYSSLSSFKGLGKDISINMINNLDLRLKEIKEQFFKHADKITDKSSQAHKEEQAYCKFRVNR